MCHTRRQVLLAEEVAQRVDVGPNALDALELSFVQTVDGQRVRVLHPPCRESGGGARDADQFRDSRVQ
jgi:hypothetical protein